MKYFFDTEFIEDGITIELISIGIVCEDGREYYAINIDCDLNAANEWVRENVVNRLPDKPETPGCSETNKKAIAAGWRNLGSIRSEVAEFLGCNQRERPLEELRKYPSIRPHQIIEFYIPETLKPPEFWAYYADYDWVVFCQLFGTMMDLPKGFPMYCNDLIQECNRLSFDPQSVPQENEHNALDDARWNKRLFEKLQPVSSNQSE